MVEDHGSIWNLRHTKVGVRVFPSTGSRLLSFSSDPILCCKLPLPPHPSTFNSWDKIYRVTPKKTFYISIEPYFWIKRNRDKPSLFMRIQMFSYRYALTLKIQWFSWFSVYRCLYNVFTLSFGLRFVVIEFLFLFYFDNCLVNSENNKREYVINEGLSNQSTIK